ncbi:MULTISPECIES: hypothetical protein [unclassified Streptomyces]|uniref:hypothetical protein n=1 Tax=unclassified Streptomyces TaxID=2593676 RepID=UPI00131E29A8|nr:hypothetical protein [Streptomyces sp. CB01635]
MGGHASVPDPGSGRVRLDHQRRNLGQVREVAQLLVALQHYHQRQIEPVAALTTFGAVWAVLAVGHNLAEYVIGQTDRQAAGKGAPCGVSGGLG